MKIVVLETMPFDAEGDMDWTALRALGKVTLYPRTLPEQAEERLADADIAFSNKVPVGAREMDAAPRLRLINVIATGYDVVDVAEARRRGVTVCNVPAYSTASTAQTTVALLLELCHHVGRHSEEVRAGAWQREGIWSFWRETPVEMDGKTLAIVGLGAVGGRVARIAEAIGMRVVAAQVPGREGGASAAGPSPYPRLPLDDALAAADVVSLHCPLTPQTRGMMNVGRLALMKPTAFLVNSSRGLLVDEAAVAEALRSGRLAGYAADVLSTEPPASDNPLLSAPRCILTPHYAWTSRESRRRLLAISVENVRAFLAGAPQNVVS